mmetsp:Transcript_92228/g.285012  ORF Transcript_92228/g.285012 Transcript_92228/m.285012 type:complete len:149 (-) Transcript_92228:34-480(-)
MCGMTVIDINGAKLVSCVLTKGGKRLLVVYFVMYGMTAADMYGTRLASCALTKGGEPFLVVYIVSAVDLCGTELVSCPPKTSASFGRGLCPSTTRSSMHMLQPEGRSPKTSRRRGRVFLVLGSCRPIGEKDSILTIGHKKERNPPKGR